MFVCTKGDDKESYMTVDDEKLDFTNVVLQFNNKSKHTKLLDYQKYRSFKVKDDKGNRWNYKFEFKLEDTSHGEMFLYQTDCSQLELNKIYLFVCTTHICSHNVLPNKHAKLHKIKLDNIKFHFLSSENNIDVIGKHKGIISKLQEKDLVIFGGEVYKTSNNLIYNIQSGALRKSMFLNNENLYIHKNKKNPENKNCNLFHDIVVAPIMKLLSEDLEFDYQIRQNYGLKITYNQLEEIIGKYEGLKYRKYKIKQDKN